MDDRGGIDPITRIELAVWPARICGSVRERSGIYFNNDVKIRVEEARGNAAAGELVQGK